MLGLGHTADMHLPSQVKLFDAKTEPAASVSCGGWHTVVVGRSGACYVFGRGEFGRLGLGDTRSHHKPHKVISLWNDHKQNRIIQAAAGGSHTLFLTDKGEALSCGRTEYVERNDDFDIYRRYNGGVSISIVIMDQFIYKYLYCIRVLTLS
jgi:alpha-tubulin suppressor-like RCC1 family protein